MGPIAPDALLQVTIDTLSEGVVVQDRDARIVMSNPAAARLLGLDLDGVTGVTSFDPRWRALRENGTPFPPEEHPAVETLRTGRPVRGVVMDVGRGDGRRVWLRVNADPIRDPAGPVIGVVVSFRDITDEREARAALVHSREELAEAQRIARLGAFTVTSDGHASWSEEMFRLHGRHPSAGAPPLDRYLQAYVSAEDAALVEERVLAALERGEPFEIEYEIRREDGTIRHLLARGRPTLDGETGPRRVRGTVSDVTELVEARRRAARLERLESLGRLAAGVAYDVNNLLYGIGLLGGFIEQNPSGPEVGQYAGEIIEAAAKGTEMTRAMTAFGEMGTAWTAAVDLADLVRATVPFIAERLGPRIEIETDLPGGLPRAQVDSAGIRQALANLAVRASDAMDGGGRLTISLGQERLGGRHAVEAGLDPGSYLRLSVADGGEPIPSELLERVFEPFVAPKPQNTGTGFELAATYGIVRANRGGVVAETGGERGTVFRLYLPIASGTSS